MLIRAVQFNIYFLIAVVACALTGCQSEASKYAKQTAALRIHLEVPTDETGFNEPIIVGRTSPISLNVEKAPILTESEVAEARVIDAPGGFALQIRFSWRGKQLLEQYTAANPGKRMAIFVQFGEKRQHSRALAAPRISGRIKDGVLTFTPDTDRKEAEEIILGLNNVAEKMQPTKEK